MYNVTVYFTEGSPQLHVKNVRNKPEYGQGGTCGVIAFSREQDIYMVRESSVNYVKVEKQ